MPQAASGRPQYYYDLHVRDRFGRDYASVQMRWDGVFMRDWFVHAFALVSKKSEVD